MKKIFLTFLLFALFPLAAYGDTIFLKDGTKITTKKAWEENGLIKFYLEGSESIIITYSKNIIDRIVEGDTKQVKKKEIEGKKPQSEHQAPVTKKPAGTASTLTAQNQDNKESDGLLFYNPRRKHKYWVSSTSWHNTLEAAIAALAEKYDRNPEWIKTNMGDTNSLYKIHKNLANSKVLITAQYSVKFLIHSFIIREEPINTGQAAHPGIIHWKLQLPLWLKNTTVTLSG